MRDGKHPLDSSAVHPERYALVEKMAEDAGCTVKDLMADGGLRAKIEIKKYATADVRRAHLVRDASSPSSPSPAATRASASRPSPSATWPSSRTFSPA